MKTITLNFLLFITIFFGHCSLFSMQKFEGSYKKFLEQKKEQPHYAQQSNDSDSFFYSKEELGNDLILETTVNLRCSGSLFGTKEIKNSKLNPGAALIAAIDYFVFDKKSPEHCECLIQGLITVKAYRKKGYASQLLHILETELKQVGSLQITLGAYQKKVSFYEKRGFVPTKKIGETFLVEMHKELLDSRIIVE